MIVKPTDDYRIEFTTTFTLEPLKTAFIPIDLQYASACRTTGLGKTLSAKGKECLGQYRFDRIEKKVIPTVQKLLAFFRNHQLRIIYVTVGSQMFDYSDILPHRVPFAKSNK